MSDQRPVVGAATDELLIDHEYDGIREYDNPMPGWWVYTWLATVIFCGPYIMWFHGKEGRTVEDDYERSIARHAQRMIAAYGDLAADDETVLRYMDDAIAMTGMASQFRGKCAVCHAADGSGNVGPNLTDDAWLHVAAPVDIVRVIRDGVPAKGMTPWGAKFSDTELVLMAAYVASLRLEPVAGKAPQGAVIPPWPESGVASTESTDASGDEGTR